MTKLSYPREKLLGTWPYQRLNETKATTKIRMIRKATTRTNLSR